jgi:hypothetical protein
VLLGSGDDDTIHVMSVSMFGEGDRESVDKYLRDKGTLFLDIEDHLEDSSLSPTMNK